VFRPSVTVDTDILDAIADAARTAPKQMATQFKRQQQRLASQGLEDLTAEPPEWTGKRRWKSDKQRILVIIKLKQADNLPYRRDHSLVKAWKVVLEATEAGGLFAYENNRPEVAFVQGDWTQPMHLDSGWPQAGVIVAKYRELAEDRLIETWYTVIDPFAGAKG